MGVEAEDDVTGADFGATSGFVVFVTRTSG